MVLVCCGHSSKFTSGAASLLPRMGRNMDTDDLEPAVKKPDIKNLEIMSIEALVEYIAELSQEIERVGAEISLKEKARDGAESVFRK